VPLVALAESSWSPAEVSTVKWTEPLPCCTPATGPGLEFWKSVVSVHGPEPGLVRMNNHCCMPGGTFGSWLTSEQKPLFVPLPVHTMVSAAAGCTTTRNHATVTARATSVLVATRPRRVR
jgi:hypothetical protein